MTPDPRKDSLLAVAAELEARDEHVARELEHIGDLAARAEAVGVRARELSLFHEALPGELAALGRGSSEARQRLEAAQAEEDAAARRLAELEGKRRAEDQQAHAERELTRARDAAGDASRQLERAEAGHAELLDAQRRSLAEADGLAVEARAISSEVGDLPRVSASGRAEPGTGLAALAAWAERVQAALFVARSSLAAEREGVIREASELGTAVLGESLGGSSVALVRRRIDQALQDS